MPKAIAEQPLRGKRLCSCAANRTWATNACEPRGACANAHPFLDPIGRIGRHFAAHARCILLASCVTLATLATVAADLGGLVALATQRFGAQGGQALTDWQQLIAYAEGLEIPEQLALVNDFFNRRVQFTDDLTLWQQPDYWATPLETLGRGAGDCEDFSIAKYTTLKLLGVAPDRMRLIYVKARTGGPSSKLFQAHMVLGYYPTPTAEPLVLDNLINEIRPASRRSDLSPVFSFNGEGLWVGGAGQSSADPTERLSRWRDLLARMREDGLD